MLAEVAGGVRGHGDVGAGEQHQDQREAGGEGLDRRRFGNGDRMIMRTWKAINPISTTSQMTSHVTAAPTEE